KTKLPGGDISRSGLLELRAEMARLNLRRDSEEYAALWERKHKEASNRPADYTDIEKSALDISGHLGLLGIRGSQRSDRFPKGYMQHESLDRWTRHADEIQTMFFGRDVHKSLPDYLNYWPIHGQLDLTLSYGPGGVFMRLVPRDTGSALLYHAA